MGDCIVAIGDSITHGEVPYKSWRYWLWKSLLEAGVTFSWTGSMNSYWPGANQSHTFNNMTFPNHHEGHWGWRADQILAELEGWAQNYTCQPNCALVHLGTNDACQGNDGQSTVDELLLVPEVLRRLGDSNMTVLLALPIPTCCGMVDGDLTPRIRAIGDDAPGRRFLVDQATGFDRTSMTYDGCHPNELGEQAMAAKWHEAVMQHCVNVSLAVGVQRPPPSHPPPPVTPPLSPLPPQLPSQLPHIQQQPLLSPPPLPYPAMLSNSTSSLRTSSQDPAAILAASAGGLVAILLLVWCGVIILKMQRRRRLEKPRQEVRVELNGVDESANCTSSAVTTDESGGGACQPSGCASCYAT